MGRAASSLMALESSGSVSPQLRIRSREARERVPPLTPLNKLSPEGMRSTSSSGISAISELFSDGSSAASAALTEPELLKTGAFQKNRNFALTERLSNETDDLQFPWKSSFYALLDAPVDGGASSNLGSRLAISRENLAKISGDGEDAGGYLDTTLANQSTPVRANTICDLSGLSC